MPGFLSNDDLPGVVREALPAATDQTTWREAFNADPNPRKVNLGVGVYTDDDGKVPLLECVRRAERALTEKGAPHPFVA